MKLIQTGPSTVICVCNMNGNKEINRKFSLDSLGYSLDCGGSVGKSKECKMRRGSESMKGRVLDEAHFEHLNKNIQRGSLIRSPSTIEEEGTDHNDGLQNRSSFKNHSKTFIKNFPEIAEMEDLVNAYTCALQKEVLYHGKMYVSHQYVCFYSSVLLKETKVQIHVSTIQIIKKKNTARVVPNAISIITNTGDKYLFGSLRNREVCFNVLKSICPQLQYVCASRSPQMSSAENGPELDADTISSQSSQEDSGDHQRFSVLKQNSKTDSNVSLSSSASNISHVKARNNSTAWNGNNGDNRDDHSSVENTVEARNSTSWNSTNRDGQSSEEAISWVAMVTEKIRSLLSMGGTTSVNRLIIVYLILALLLLLSSGYIGLRIAALEEQLHILGTTTEFGLQRSHKET